MEREQYRNQIQQLLEALTTVLEANKALGARVEYLEKALSEYEALKSESGDRQGELAMRKRRQYGRRTCASSTTATGRNWLSWDAQEVLS